MLWSIFEALASALCVMQAGHLPDQPPPTTAYQGIIHNDLKPENIFLAKPLADFWAGIPVAKVGDFGLAELLNSDRAQRQGGGTTGYRAPEGCSYPDGSPYQNNTVQDGCTDVWVVGRIMLSLMRLDNGRAARNQKVTLDNIFMPSVPQAQRANFPAAMVDLVHACLERDNVDRPSAFELWNSIQQEVGVRQGGGLFDRPLRMRERDPAELIFYSNTGDIYASLG